MILSDDYILNIIDEEEFKTDYVPVLEELALHIDRSGANVIIELHSRQLYDFLWI